MCGCSNRSATSPDRRSHPGHLRGRVCLASTGGGHWFEPGSAHREKPLPIERSFSAGLRYKRPRTRRRHGPEAAQLSWLLTT